MPRGSERSQMRAGTDTGEEEGLRMCGRTGRKFQRAIAEGERLVGDNAGLFVFDDVEFAASSGRQGDDRGD
jgi:hypothetical protein